MVRAWKEAGQLTAADGPLPMLDEVGFTDAQGLADRVLKYFRNGELRESVVAAQRRSIGARLSYDAGIRRVTGRIADLLAETAEAMASTALPERADRIAA